MQAVEKAKIRHFTPSLDGNYQDQMIQETDQAHLEFSYAIAEAQARLIRLFGIGVEHLNDDALLYNLRNRYFYKNNKN